MKSKPKIGTTGERTFVVEKQHAIDFSAEGMPFVLSTPWLIWFLEHAARDALLSVLEPGESSVGVQVELEHLAATPLGRGVSCRARVIQVDRRLVSFQLEAHDDHGPIARGLHKRRVINVDRFRQHTTER